MPTVVWMSLAEPPAGSALHVVFSTILCERAVTAAKFATSSYLSYFSKHYHNQLAGTKRGFVQLLLQHSSLPSFSSTLCLNSAMARVMLALTLCKRWADDASSPIFISVSCSHPSTPRSPILPFSPVITFLHPLYRRPCCGRRCVWRARSPHDVRRSVRRPRAVHLLHPARGE